MEKQTDKGLVVGLFVEDALKPPKEKEKAVPDVAPAAAVEEDEAPTVEAEVIDPEEAPRKSRGRPRKYID